MNFVDDYNKMIIQEIDRLKTQNFIFPTHEEYRLKIFNDAQKRVSSAQEMQEEAKNNFETISQDASKSAEDKTYAEETFNSATENLSDAQGNLSTAQQNLDLVRQGNISSSLQNDYEDYLINLYFNIKAKTIPPVKRTVHKCTSFVVPPQYQEAVATIETAISNGEDLFPRLSRQIFKADFKDMMMFDFGITHLHLGMTPDQNHAGLVQGGSDVLYAMFTPTDAYLIKIGPHGLWNDRQLLIDIDNSFPNALDPYKTFGRPEPEYSDDDRLMLKKENINTSFMVNNKHIMPPGMGMNAAGTSMQATMQLCFMRKNVQRLQNFVKLYETPLKEKYQFSNIDFQLKYISSQGAIGFDNTNNIQFTYDYQTDEICFLKKEDDNHYTLLDLQI